MNKARSLCVLCVFLLTTTLLLWGSGTAMAAPSARRTPVVVFPAFHFTKLLVTVSGQTTAPGCPASGTFEEWFLNDTPTTFSQVCQDKLLTLVYDGNPAKPRAQRFSNQPGVTVAIKDFGRTESAPFYEAFYRGLAAAGWVRDKNIRVAGYNPRLTPDMDHILARTKRLMVSVRTGVSRSDGPSNRKMLPAMPACSA